MSRARVLLFTAQEAGCLLLETLARRSDLDILVVTDQTSRDAANGYRSPMALCDTLGIKYIRATRIGVETLAQLRVFSPHLILSVYFPHIIGSQVRALARAVNIHPGVLPRYRGRYPTPWYILNGEPTFGLAIHLLDDGIDTGAVLLQNEYEVPPGITGHELYVLTQTLAADLIASNLDAILAGDIVPVPQQSGGSYYSRIEPRFHIDWNMSAEMIARQIRVHAKPYFPAYGFILNRMILINRARTATRDSFVNQGGGQIVEVARDGSFIVSASNGLVLVEEYEIAPAIAADNVIGFLKVGERIE